MRRAVVIAMVALLPGTVALAGGKHGKKEEKISKEELPQSVRDTLAKQWPGSTIVEAERENGGYEVKIKTAGGKQLEIDFDAAGKAHEDKEEEED